MKQENSGKRSNAIIDIIMVVVLISSAISLSFFEKLEEELKNGAKIEDVFTWKTPHCITSLILIAIILIHVWQRRKFLKMIITKNLYLKNKLTTLITISFILTLVSVFLYLFGFTSNTLHFHSMIVHFFVIIVIVHLIVNFKKFIKLFQNV